MSSHVVNPKYKPYRGLDYTTEEWDALKAKITAELVREDSKSTVETASLRRLDPAFAKEMVWAQISADLKLFEVSG